MGRADGALLIGDRALEVANAFPDMVRLDLGQAWTERHQLPMIFGVFVARRDTPLKQVHAAHRALLGNLEDFESDGPKRDAVIRWSMERSDLTYERLDQYYGEVFNRLNERHVEGLSAFLIEACELDGEPEFAW